MKGWGCWNGARRSFSWPWLGFKLTKWESEGPISSPTPLAGQWKDRVSEEGGAILAFPQRVLSFRLLRGLSQSWPVPSGFLSIEWVVDIVYNGSRNSPQLAKVPPSSHSILVFSNIWDIYLFFKPSHNKYVLPQCNQTPGEWNGPLVS